MKKSILTLLCWYTALYSYTQSLELDWKFTTTDYVLASPLIQNNTVFIGDQSGVFFAIDAGSGMVKWRVETGGSIQAKATLVDKHIFFESANIFYLVDAENGNMKWTFDTEMDPFVFKYQGI